MGGPAGFDSQQAGRKRRSRPDGQLFVDVRPKGKPGRRLDVRAHGPSPGEPALLAFTQNAPWQPDIS
jgi:hypothetical protein